LAVNADADIVLVDMQRRGIIRGADLHSIGNATPFEGCVTIGSAVRTIVRGRTVAIDGRPVAAPGWGRNVAELSDDA
jgi:dihydroorotase-like cyclic amidohydrolase